MYDFIERLWADKYSPSKKNIIKNEEISLAERTLARKEEELFATLNEKQRIIYDEIANMFFEISDLRQLNAYLKGALLVSSIVKELF